MSDLFVTLFVYLSVHPRFPENTPTSVNNDCFKLPTDVRRRDDGDGRARVSDLPRESPPDRQQALGPRGQAPDQPGALPQEIHPEN